MLFLFHPSVHLSISVFITLVSDLYVTSTCPCVCVCARLCMCCIRVSASHKVKCIGLICINAIPFNHLYLLLRACMMHVAIDRKNITLFFVLFWIVPLSMYTTISVVAVATADAKYICTFFYCSMSRHTQSCESFFFFFYTSSEMQSFLFILPRHNNTFCNTRHSACVDK